MQSTMRKGFKKEVTESETSSAPSVRSPTRIPSYITVTIMHRSYDQSYSSSLVFCSVSVCTSELCLVVYVFFLVVLGPPGSHNPFSPSSTGFPEVCLMFGCESLYLLLYQLLGKSL